MVVVAPTSATATTKPSATTTAAALGTIRLRLGLIDGQGSSTKIGSVQCGNCFIGCTGIGHFHEPETPRAPGFAVRYKGDFFHGAVRFEDVTQFGFGGAVGQIANIQVLHCISSLM